MAVLEVKNLQKRFGSFTAVNGVSFSLQEGEILGFLGPNGAGKTTTIQMLLGVLTPTAGDIAYFGKDLRRHRSEIMEQVNFSSTYTNLPWDLQVNECLKFVSRLYAISDRPGRIAKIVQLFQLEPLLRQRISELSAGQQTRVNLAKAFLNFPKVLLLDEPTASLDPDVADYIRKFLMEERKKFQVSIIFTSHNMAEVEEVCDRVVFINHGKIIADSTPQELARSVTTSHIELRLQGDKQRFESFFRQEGFAFAWHGDYVRVDVPEMLIAEFLHSLSQQGLRYSEISIDKPSLEDFFIQQTKRKNHGDP